jgi:hypothetical protein
LQNASLPIKQTFGGKIGFGDETLAVFAMEECAALQNAAAVTKLELAALSRAQVNEADDSRLTDQHQVHKIIQNLREFSKN